MLFRSALQAQIELLTGERDAAVAAAAQVAREAEEKVAQLQAETEGLATAHRTAVRRALLAEHAGQLVPELVRGDTAEDLEASVTLAREAYGRIAQDLRTAAAAMVPVGASASSEPDPDQLSPLQKITNALSRNGRG